jgi:ferrous iron transport protein A
MSKSPLSSSPLEAQTLADVATGQVFEIVDIAAPAATPDWNMRLQEIGFIVGEHVQILRRSMPGGDPLAIRVSDSTFALRRAEAACVRVRPVHVQSIGRGAA